MWVIYHRDLFYEIDAVETAAEARRKVIVHNGNADDSDLWAFRKEER